MSPSLQSATWDPHTAPAGPGPQGAPPATPEHAWPFAAGDTGQMAQAMATLPLLFAGRLDGRAAGLHRAFGLGQSETFAEHRAYVPGDDLRHIDWRASARHARPHMKTYAHEAQGALQLVLDTTASMDYPAAPPGAAPVAARADHKFDGARALAYALGCAALRQGDAVGLSVFGADAQAAARQAEVLPPGQHPRQKQRLLQILARLVPHGSAPFLPYPNARAAGPHGRFVRTRRRLRFVFIGDLLTAPAQSIHTLQSLAKAQHEVRVVQLLHPHELHLPFAGEVALSCLETAAKTTVDVAQERAAYGRRAAAYLDEVRGQLWAAGLPAVLCVGHGALVRTLAWALTARPRAVPLSPA